MSSFFFIIRFIAEINWLNMERYIRKFGIEISKIWQPWDSIQAVYFYKSVKMKCLFKYFTVCNIFRMRHITVWNLQSDIEWCKNKWAFVFALTCFIQEKSLVDDELNYASSLSRKFLIFIVDNCYDFESRIFLNSILWYI